MMFEPISMPCPECGESLPADEQDRHVCEPDRRSEYEFVRTAAERADFDRQLDEWLDSPQGRFARYLAERDRRG